MWNEILESDAKLNRYLLQNDINERKNSFTVFEYACLTGKIKAIKRIMKERRLDMNSVNTEGRTVLHRLCYFSLNSQLLDLLLSDKRLNRDQKDVDGLTPLHHAVFRKNIHLIRALFQFPIDINKCDQYGRSPLAIAVDNSWLVGVELLLSHPFCDGSSVLARSVQLRGQIATSIFKLILVDPHTNPNIPDHLGTALYHARRLNFPTRINMLLFDDLETRAQYFPPARLLFISSLVCASAILRLPMMLWYEIFSYNRVIDE